MNSNIVLKPPMKENLRQAYSVVDSARLMTASDRLAKFSYVNVGGDPDSDGNGGSEDGRLFCLEPKHCPNLHDVFCKQKGTAKKTG